jgi:hypothetical protein
MTRALAILSVTLLLFGATVALAQTTTAPPSPAPPAASPSTPGGATPPSGSVSPGTPATPRTPATPPTGTTTTPDTTTPRTTPDTSPRAGDPTAPADRGMSPLAWVILGLVALGLIIWMVSASRRRDRDVVSTHVEREVRPYDRDRDRAA